MPTALVDGITTRYEVAGAGPPLLLFSPGGFNGTLDNWRTFGIYKRLNLLEHLTERYTCITFDKRESGRSGGRVERITWADYAAQGAGLLDHLEIERAHLMGGCIGCSIVAAFAVAQPERVSSMVLYSPAGGPRYRMTQRARFAEHLEYVAQHGLGAVVALAASGDESFANDPRVGPWASVIRTDAAFADEYARLDADSYRTIVDELARTLFDRDTVPGAEPEELMQLQIPTFVVPGQDANHATSAARYLEECLPRSEYWDVPVDEQTEATAPARVLEFLQRSDSPRSSAAI
ncbi:MAG TPA: alpha/beta hydrolase [Gaiellaceae bacterium]|jgi:pimeloyl-ACP methyl ester carboxylesterase|nr:alpha/beta hydrolase [Gaiellaceae bacterium]